MCKIYILNKYKICQYDTACSDQSPKLANVNINLCRMAKVKIQNDLLYILTNLDVNDVCNIVFVLINNVFVLFVNIPPTDESIICEKRSTCNSTCHNCLTCSNRIQK